MMRDLVTALGNLIRFVLALIVVLLLLGIHRLLFSPMAFFH